MRAPAPLNEIPGAPAPAGGEAFWMESDGGVRLRAALFRPSGRARGSVVLSGGRTEPVEKYYEVIGELLARGFVVLAHDWRGQGLSQRYLDDRLRGHAEGFDHFLADYRGLIGAFAAELPKPWIALGHSMGGCLTLLALARDEARGFSAAVLSAPMLGLRLPLPAPMVSRLASLATRGKRGAAYALGQSTHARDDAFDGNRLTHDERRFRRWREQLKACPDLALAGVTWGWLAFAFAAMGELARPGALDGVDIPVIAFVAEGDQIVDTRAQRLVLSRLKHGKVIIVPGSRHEILQEIDERRALFWAEFDALAERLAPGARWGQAEA
jgi:alpha-beta hydrolase superfamily lysophospholipase